ERLYGQGAGYSKAGVEIVKCRATATVQISTPPRAPDAPAGAPDWSAAVKARRPAWFPGGQGPVEVTTVDGERLQAGNRLQGPLIVERPGDTVVIPPGVEAYVDPFLNIRMALA